MIRPESLAAPVGFPRLRTERGCQGCHSLGLQNCPPQPVLDSSAAFSVAIVPSDPAPCSGRALAQRWQKAPCRGATGGSQLTAQMQPSSWSEGAGRSVLLRERPAHLRGRTFVDVRTLQGQGGGLRAADHVNLGSPYWEQHGKSSGRDLPLAGTGWL